MEGKERGIGTERGGGKEMIEKDREREGGCCEDAVGGDRGAAGCKQHTYMGGGKGGGGEEGDA
jgi:hypothetical protein